MAKDYYDVLGVKREASDTDIRAAFRNLAKKYHPDRNQGDASAEKRFKEINEAYEVLRDREKRQMYDMYGSDGLRGGDGGGFAGGFDFGGGGFADIFESVFDMGGFRGASRGQHHNRRRRGGDLRYRIELTLEEMLAGKETSIRFEAPAPCEHCHGTGGSDGGQRVNCPDCGGRGFRTIQRGLIAMQTSCSACGGSGEVLRDLCSHCSGQGRVMGQVTRHIKIPAGVSEDTRLRLRGQGEAGFNGGEAGDLYVVVQQKDHVIFHRDGDSLICYMPISLTTAALGGEIDVPTIDGSLLTIKVKAGTQSGHRLRIAKKGMPHINGGGRRDDMFVEIFVETPSNLSQEQKELLTRFEELAQERENQPQSSGFFNKIKEMFS